jgi:hypothetical protein
MIGKARKSTRAAVGLATVMSLAATVGCGADLPGPAGLVSDGPIELRDGQTVGGPSRRLDRDDGPRFSGLAWTEINGSTCSGALVTPAALQDVNDGPAYLLTAGHCVMDRPQSPNQIVTAMPGQGPRDTVVFRRFADSSDHATRVPVRQLAYATMKGIDLAIVELARTRRELREGGIVPFVLAEAPVATGVPIAVAGHPNLDFARLVACAAGARVPLVLEAGFHWFDAVTNACADIAPGSSGSPIFSLDTGEVIGVQNSMAFRGQRCAFDSPCEVAPGGVTFAPGTVYGGAVDRLARCFDATGSFDLDAPGCPLDRGEQMTADPEQLMLLATSTAPVRVTFALASNGLSHYRHAFGPATTTDCRSPSVFGPITAFADAPSIALAAPPSPDPFVLCLQAGRGADVAHDWQPSSTPTTIAVSVTPSH